ncbi:cell division protein ZapA [Phreatobacter aquaticus]|uniref:Cell division protein ZapA n=1 Tax=Phreatobacter aquaticus TaxID=2570229 RepID=A0A4D7QN91_9HYPH|nr:cell division protein ZapA [Phreatobacter aquaticus]QCK86744.1 cell division protein ZapA [Phreatobacter aquaticus]
MAHVSVTINGRQFRMACDDGQEDHLLKLADDVNGKVDQLKGAFGEIGDTRLTVMAAIMVADELADVKRRLRQAEAEIAATREARALLIERAEVREAQMAEAIEHAVGTIERMTADLMSSGRGGDR